MQKIRFLGQKLWPVACIHLNRITDTHTYQAITEDTFFMLQESSVSSFSLWSRSGPIIYFYFIGLYFSFIIMYYKIKNSPRDRCVIALVRERTPCNIFSLHDSHLGKSCDVNTIDVCADQPPDLHSSSEQGYDMSQKRQVVQNMDSLNGNLSSQN